MGVALHGRVGGAGPVHARHVAARRLVHQSTRRQAIVVGRCEADAVVESLARGVVVQACERRQRPVMREGDGQQALCTIDHGGCAVAHGTLGVAREGGCSLGVACVRAHHVRTASARRRDVEARQTGLPGLVANVRDASGSRGIVGAVHEGEQCVRAEHGGESRNRAIALREGGVALTQHGTPHRGPGPGRCRNGLPARDTSGRTAHRRAPAPMGRPAPRPARRRGRGRGRRERPGATRA